jgi:hypothetical protein
MRAAIRAANGAAATDRRGSVRRGRGWVAAAAMAALLTGCGIRSTSVPVDAGPAPSRVSCEAPKAPTTPEPNSVIRPVYLVCSMQIAAVSRSVPARDSRFDWTTQATELVAQLQMSPRAGEGKAGFSTAVPGALWITAPAKGDPKDSLRLNQAPDELPSFALAQLVCTLTANPQIAPHRQVILGGPPPDGKLRSYSCTPGLRTDPEAADTAGTAVG